MSQKDIDREVLESFLDELTMLSRKHGLTLFSHGEMNAFAVRKDTHDEVNSGRYTLHLGGDWDGALESPVEIIWSYEEDLQNVIDIDKLTK